MKHIVFAFLGLLVAMVVLSQVGVFLGNRQAGITGTVAPRGESVVVEEEQVAATTFEVEAVESGVTALELLEQSAQVAYEEYDFGTMVTKINGLQADDSHYWALYINDEYATAGASATILAQGDTMKWVYEAIDTANFQ